MQRKQQDFIVFVIVGLIAVMVAFAIFDHISDEGRFERQMALEQQAIAAFPGAAPYRGAVNFGAAGAGFACPGCGMMGPMTANARCPNCFAFVGNPNAGSAPTLGAVPGEVQNAAFLWRQPQPNSAAPGGNVLACPGCNFVMSAKHKVAPNMIRCPRCPSYLAGAGISAGGNAQFGAQAAAYAGRYGLGFNPACPVR
jgi:uncharacterized paraquat-inducible protein A